METRTVADALAKGLRRHGVTDIFGQSLPSALFLATPRVGIRQIAYRTENAGGAMADGYARASRAGSGSSPRRTARPRRCSCRRWRRR